MFGTVPSRREDTVNSRCARVCRRRAVRTHGSMGSAGDRSSSA